MVHKLSEQLAELSARAKKAEDSLTEAQQEARDKLAARTAQAHAAASAAMAKVDQEIAGLDATASRQWSAARAKVSADMAALKTRVESARRDWDFKLADERADRLEQDAVFAIDYAIASVEQANLAVLDAVEGRATAEAAAVRA